MATSYPGAVDAFPNPSGSTDVDDASADLKHHNQHANVNDAVEAIEGELGPDPSGSFATVKARLDAQRRTPVTAASGTIYAIPGVTASAHSTTARIAANDCYHPIHAEDYLTFDRVAVEVTTAGTAGATGRVGLYAAGTDWQPTGTLIEDFGSFLIDSTGIKTMTPSGGSRTIPGGRYLLALNISAAATFRCVRGGIVSQQLTATAGSLFITQLAVSRAHAVFPSTPLAWTTASPNTVPFEYPILLRVTA
jgi:hypothetical protein